MKLNVPMFVLNAGVAAVLGTLANNVTAAEPLSLTLAQSLSHDTNFSRTTTSLRPMRSWLWISPMGGKTTLVLHELVPRGLKRTAIS